MQVYFVTKPNLVLTLGFTMFPGVYYLTNHVDLLTIVGPEQVDKGSQLLPHPCVNTMKPSKTF